jgi:flagellin
MSITILNNVSSLVAENAVSSTQASLQKTLQQLSTGLKINSGADDPAGLSIANGLGANIAALTQSSQNASNGIGLLQTADGALSQVTTILNQAVTIATEASNGGLTASQTTALGTEFTSILTEITNIGTRPTSMGVPCLAPPRIRSQAMARPTAMPPPQL